MAKHNGRRKSGPDIIQLRRIAQQEAYAYTDKLRGELVIELTPKFMVLFLFVLHDELGFGKKRLMRILTRVQDLSDSIDKRYITFRDLIDTLYEETGVDLRGMEKKQV